jgi:hypothetical protein
MANPQKRQKTGPVVTTRTFFALGRGGRTAEFAD